MKASPFQSSTSHRSSFNFNLNFHFKSNAPSLYSNFDSPSSNFSFNLNLHLFHPHKPLTAIHS